MFRVFVNAAGSIGLSDRRLRVLQVANSLNFGGLERLVVDLALGLDRSRFEPLVACLKYKGNLAPELEAAGVPVFALNADVDPRLRYRTFRDLQHLIREQRVDVVHTHNTGPLIDTLLARLTQWRGIRVVHTDHTRPNWPDTRRRVWAEYLASFWVRSFVAVSEEARDKLVEYEGIHRHRIRLIDNGINLDRFLAPEADRQAMLAKLGATGFDQCVGVIAMHRRQKGITHLLQAIPWILKDCPNTGFLIAGGGPLEEAHQEEARALGISEHVRFLGRRSDVPNLLSTFDVYVLPSESEGLPIGLLEAMAASKPIVATAVGAVPRVLNEGACGRLVEPGVPMALATAVIELLQDHVTARALADAARERVVAEFSIQRTIQDYQRLYRQAAEGVEP